MLADTLDLYRGELLEGLALANAPEFEVWLLGERARYVQLYQRGLSGLVEQLITAGRYEQALQRAQQLVQSDPLLEAAHMRLTWLYARLGQRGAAVAQFHECCTLLQRELAVEPTPEFIQLHQQILRNELPIEKNASGTAHLQTTPAPFLGSSDPFVGRAGELERLQRAWQESQRHNGVVVLIEGATGSGKTRLVQEFTRCVPAALFLVGRCYESTRTMPYRPWIDLLQARLALGDDGDLEWVAPYYLAQLARLLPEVAARRGFPALAVASSFPSEQEHLFAAVAEILLHPPATDGKDSPLLLFVDDLQWADEASLQVFHALTQRIQRQSRRPVMLLGAFRSEEVDDNPALLTLVADLRRSSALLTLALPPLAPSSVEALMVHLWPDLVPGDHMPSVRDALIRATGANPLFLTELLRTLAHANTLPATLPLPSSLRDLIQRRLRHLSASGRQVIEALAVFDVPATLDQARQISGRSDDETTMAIDLGLRRGLLRSLAEAQPPRLDFAHDLMRRAVVAQVSAARRQRLHWRAAATLEQRDVPAATLAYHWRMAGASAKEARYAALAGEAAAAVYANDEAARYFQRALELSSDLKQRIGLMLRLGEVWQLTGKWTEAEAIYREALKQALQADDGEAEARSRVRLGSLMIAQGAYLKALPSFEQVIHADEARVERTIVCQALGGMASVSLGQGKFREALAYNEQQYHLAGELHDRLEMSEALGNMGVACMHLEDYPRAVHCMEEKLRIASELGHKQQMGLALRHLAALYQHKFFEYRYAWSCYDQMLPLFQEIGDIPALAIALNNLTILYLDIGAYEHAITCAVRHLQVSLDLGSHLDIALVLAHIGQAWSGQQRAHQAKPIYERALALITQQEIPYFFGMNLIHAARVYETVGAFHCVQQLADDALRLARASSQLKQVEFSALVLLIRVRLAVQQLDAAGAVRELEQLAAQWPDEQEQAAVHDELERLHLDAAQARQHGAVAAALYHDLYLRTRLIQYRQRYEALTSEPIADLAQVPAPPAIVTAYPLDLEALLARVDHRIAADGP